MRMDVGMKWFLKNPTVFKNDTSLPSSFYLHKQLAKSQGWVVLTVGVVLAKLISASV